MSSTDTAKKQVDFLLRYALQTFAAVLLIAILVRTFFISSYVMSGWSMLPTIWPGDFLLANKFQITRIHRGDVVALRCPNARDRICLKRVVGLPGDRIEFQAGALIINGEKARIESISPEVLHEAVAGHSWLIWPEENASASSQPVVVPPQQVYLLNDKRSDPEDSRGWGPVSVDMLEAKVFRIWLSLDWYEGNQVRSWPRVRWLRILRGID
jgi:signal peptidase I